MPTDFSKRLPGLEAREGRRGTCGVIEPREFRSVSPEDGTRQQHEDNREGGSGGEYGRSDSRVSRWSPGSSPEPEDNSSTSGDEGRALQLLVCTRAYVRARLNFSRPRRVIRGVSSAHQRISYVSQECVDCDDQFFSLR